MFEIVDSVGMRFSVLNAVCMGTTYDQAWIVRESEKLLVLHHHMHVYELSFMAVHVGLVGLDLSDVTEEHTTEAYSFRSLSRTA